MGNIVCKKTSTIVPSGCMCGKCPVCLGQPGTDNCPLWKKEEEPCTLDPVIRCETCSRCNMFQGYGVQCKYWTMRDKPCNNCARCGGFPGYGPQCPYWVQYDLNSKYAETFGMNDANRKVLQVLTTEGKPAAFKAMFTGEQGQELSYSEMRARYG